MSTLTAPTVFAQPVPLLFSRTARAARSAVPASRGSLLIRVLAGFFFLTACLVTPLATAQQDYLLGAGDAIRVQVFQNPDLTLETRVSETGSITYPLIGAVQTAGSRSPPPKRPSRGRSRRAASSSSRR